MRWKLQDHKAECEQFDESTEQIHKYRIRQQDPQVGVAGGAWQIRVNFGWTRIYKGWWIVKDVRGVRTLPDPEFKRTYEQEEETALPQHVEGGVLLPAKIGEWHGLIHAARTGQARNGKFTEMHQFLDQFEKMLELATAKEGKD